MVRGDTRSLNKPPYQHRMVKDSAQPSGRGQQTKQDDVAGGEFEEGRVGRRC